MAAEHWQRNEHEPLHAGGERCGELESDRGAEGMADDDRGRQVHCVKEAFKELGEEREIVRAIGLVRQTKADKVQRDNAIVLQ